MKIIFLCGSLEPGQDGVGDYTRRLAGELVSQGNQVSLVALYDKFINKLFAGIQMSNEINLRVLRIPFNYLHKHRISIAKEWIEQFRPEWISIQFVPYAFHRKGLPVLLHRQLFPLLKNKNIHLMFHEGWIGSGSFFNMKARMYSIIQELIVKRLIRSIRPVSIHTHLPYYKAQLENAGWKVKKLPLFSNIQAVFSPPVTEDQILRVGFFSQVENNEAVYSFLFRLKEEAEQSDIRFEILLIGGSEKRMHAFGKMLQLRLNSSKGISYTGHLEPFELSKVLSTCNLGVTPVPRHALGKSGSVAAFLAHGIPVAAPVIHPDYPPLEIGFLAGELRSSIMLEAKFSALETAKWSALRSAEHINISFIGSTFVADLNNANEY